MQKEEGNTSLTAAEIKAMHVVPLTGELAPDRVIVKFTVTNPKHIPEGIPALNEVKSDAEKDAENSQFAYARDLFEEAKVGRERVGRVDTGVKVVDGAVDVQAAMLRVGLVNAGYQLMDAHHFQKDRRFIICLTFGNTGDRPKAVLSRKTQEAMRALAKMVWGQAHVWLNPDRTATINLGIRRWDEPNQRYFPPQNALVVRNRQVIVAPVQAEVAEEAEAEGGDQMACALEESGISNEA